MGCSNNWCIFLIITVLLGDAGGGSNNGDPRAAEWVWGSTNGGGG